MTKLQIAVGAFATLAGAALSLRFPPPPPPLKSQARWVEHYDSLEGLKAAFQGSGDPIVYGTVLAATKGRSVSDEDGTEVAQFSNIALAVKCGKQYSPRKNPIAQIEVTGDYFSQDGAGHGAIEGIPNLRAGASFVLFLRPGPGDGWHIVNNQGAFEVVDDVLEAGDPNDWVAQSLHGQSLQAVFSEIGLPSCVR